MIWCLRRPQIIHDVGSLCISTMWLFNFFLEKRTLKQELQVKKTSGKRDRGEFDQHTLLHHQAVLRYTLPPLTLHHLLIIIILLLLLLLLLLFNEVWKACRPYLLSCRDLYDRHWPPLLQGHVGQALASSPAGTCRTGTGLLLPQVPKY